VPQRASAPLDFVKGGISAVDAALLPDGNVVVAFDYHTGDGGSGIYVVWGRDANWSEPVHFTSPTKMSFSYPAVGIDPQGRIHVIWAGMGANNGVWYALGQPE
jgi:hypothetical protein